jgi:hypothetical protein
LSVGLLEMLVARGERWLLFFGSFLDGSRGNPINLFVCNSEESDFNIYQSNLLCTCNDDDDDDVYLNKLQTKGVKKSILYNM